MEGVLVARLPQFMVAAEVAPILRVTEFEVARLCREGLLKASKPGRSWLIDPTDLQTYIDSHSNQQVPA